MVCVTRSSLGRALGRALGDWRRAAAAGLRRCCRRCRRRRGLLVHGVHGDVLHQDLLGVGRVVLTKATLTLLHVMVHWRWHAGRCRSCRRSCSSRQ